MRLPRPSFGVVARWILVVAGLALVVLQWRERTERRELLRLRDRVVQARAAAGACARDLLVAEAEFQSLDLRVDSLRDDVAAFEALDPRGVPADRYDAYLEAVDRYNDAVDAWEVSAEDLRADEEACRAQVEGYNDLADSARAGPLGDMGA